MELPKIDLPIYEIILPSNNEKVKYRPFTVKEEKVFLIAKESKDTDQNILSIKQVLNNCLIDKSIDDLAIFDIEYLLLAIRGKSVNNTADFIITDPETGEEVKLKLDVNDVQVKRDPTHSNKIRLNDEYTLFMKYPNIDLFKILTNGIKIKDPLVYYNIMLSCMEKIASSEAVYHFKDFTNEEIDKFIENLENDIISRIENFFNTAPKLRHEIKYKNTLGHEKTFVIEGTDSFFI